MELFDTHCHIQSAGLAQGERATRELWAQTSGLTTDLLVSAAAAAGVGELICVGCDVADSRLAVACASQYDGCKASIGIHPHEAVALLASGEWDAFTALASDPQVVAIGECGLDYFYEHSPRPAQIDVLERQLALAQEYELPVIFHVREAFADFWPIFDTFPGLRAVIHSFTDSIPTLHEALERGLYIGVNGIATFAKQPAQLAMYRAIPLERLILETDAPFLTPVPFRGTINEPKQIATVAAFLSRLRDEPLPALARATTNNARALFGM